MRKHVSVEDVSDADIEKEIILRDGSMWHTSLRKWRRYPLLHVNFSFPKNHYENDTLMRTMSDLFNAEILKLLQKGLALQKYLDLAGAYVDFAIDKDVKTEEPSEECPFKPTTVIEKQTFSFKKNPPIEKLGITFKLTPPMQFVLGLSPSPNIDMGMQTFLVTPTQAPSTIDVHKNPITTLWVFCDIVHPTYVKDTIKPLLRCMAVDQRSTQISYESAHNMQYKPISKSHVSSIKIWLSDSYLGNPLHSNANCAVRLEFIQQ